MDRCRKAMVLNMMGMVPLGMVLTIDIAKSLSICESVCYACIAHLDTKASEQEEGKSTLIDRCL